MQHIRKILMIPVFALSLLGCLVDDGTPIPGVMDDDGEPLEIWDDSKDPMAFVESEASVEFAACGQTGPNLTNGITTNAAYPNAANQRSGSSTSCVAVGVLQPTDDALYYCYTGASDGTWTYLKNLRTGVRGWVRDDLLRDNGSYDKCW